MPYSEEEQQRRDIDWFFTDQSGRIFHIASGGGILPKRIQENDNNRQISGLLRFISAEFKTEINQNVINIIGYQDQSPVRRDLYFESFINFAKLGLFSFDNSILGNFENQKYHLVAMPVKGFLHYNEFVRFTGVELPVVKTEIKIDDFNSFDLIDMIT